jgi:hypothetical protein
LALISDRMYCLQGGFEGEAGFTSAIHRVSFSGDITNMRVEIGLSPAAQAREYSNAFAFTHWPGRKNSFAVVADAGSNALFEVRFVEHLKRRGSLSWYIKQIKGKKVLLLTSFQDVVLSPPVNFMGQNFSSVQAVPTAVAVSPVDGDLYVALLTGFPFPVGRASVKRINRLTNAVTEHTTGFTNLVDLLFDAQGNLFVLELSTIGMVSGNPGLGDADPARIGSIKRVINPADPQSHLTVATGFVQPGGFVYRNGYFYVSNCGTCVNGEVVRVPYMT